MKIVCDTNVIVSALINPHGAPAQILRMILSGTAHVLYDTRILQEYRRVLMRPKFCFPENSVHDLLDFVEQEGTLISPISTHIPFSDPSDKPFFEVATSGKAAFLITGNRKHFPSDTESKPLRIGNPREFLTFCC